MKATHQTNTWDLQRHSTNTDTLTGTAAQAKKRSSNTIALPPTKPWLKKIFSSWYFFQLFFPVIFSNNWFKMIFFSSDFFSVDSVGGCWAAGLLQRPCPPVMADSSDPFSLRPWNTATGAFREGCWRDAEGISRDHPVTEGILSKFGHPTFWRQH